MRRNVHEAVRRWWGGEVGGAGRALSAGMLPIELGFGAAVALRNALYDHRWRRPSMADIPVISVGNLTVGGTGKTPFSAWLAARLVSWGRNPAIVLRGYGLDEIIVHHELNPTVPTFADPRRADAVSSAATAGCDVAILDDGFQHRSLARDLDIVLVAAEGARQPSRLLPRGPFREPVSALRRADWAVVTRKAASEADSLATAARLTPYLAPERIARCRMAPTAIRELAATPTRAIGLDWLAGRSMVAVTSVADPGSFVAQLEGLGAEVELIAFPDHHPFAEADARRLCARAAGRAIVMTRKEAVKLRPLFEAGTSAYFVEQSVELEDGEGALERHLRAAIGQ